MGKSFNSITKRNMSEPDYLFDDENWQAAESDDDSSDNRSCLVRRVANNLYECVSGDNYCRHLITFGYGKYCSRLLTDKFGWVGKILPHNREIDREQFD